MVRFGRDTIVKFIGGQVVARQFGDDTATMIQDLNGMARRSQDMSVPFSKFVRVWHLSERKLFREQGSPRWAALSPRYREWKIAAYPGKPILRRTDRLWRSLTTRTRDSVIQVGPRSLKLGTRDPKSVLHQTGTRSMPARPHVLLMPDAWQRLNELTMAHILTRGARIR